MTGATSDGPVDDVGSHAAGLTLRGTCLAIFAYDIGFAVDLLAAERALARPHQREVFQRQRKTPAYFRYEPAPVRVTLAQPSHEIAGHSTSPTVEAMVFDFGAISVTFQLAVDSDLGALQDLSEGLYDNETLLDASRNVVVQVLDAIRAAVTKPRLSELVEDYVIFGIRQVTPPGSIAEILTTHSHTLAQVLRAERIELSEQEITHALACRISFGKQDLVVVDWNAAIVIDEALDDARAVLEYANVELLEMRYLDDQLDGAVERAHAMLARRLHKTSFWPDPAIASLRELAEMRMESAALFENVNNALKLVGDQYLARVYQLAAERLHLGDWDTNILRKLEALESAGEKVSMLATHRRAEVLEWIIIILIAVSIGLELLALGLGH